MSFLFTLELVEPYQSYRDVTTTRLQALQSCYFSAVKFAQMDPDKSAVFCKNHSDEAALHYKDIARQMDQLTDQQYTLQRFYSKKFKELVERVQSQLPTP